MSAVIDAIQDAVSSIVDAIVDLVQAVWDDIVMPILEEIAGLLGIEDETVVHVQKVSIAIYENETRDPVQGEIIKTVLEKNATGQDFFPLYMQHILRTKGQVRSYHQYGDSGNYIHGLPTMVVNGGEVDLAGINTALDTDLGTLNTILTVLTLAGPNPEAYFKNDLQASHSYLPYNNTLTHTDPYSVVRTDWTLDSPIVYNIGPDDYTIPISRLATEAKFWIEGPGQITEGDSVTFIVRCNRTVPAGESITANFNYSGTAVDGIDYTEVASVIMTASTDFIDVVIATIETGSPDKNFTITLASITNTNAAFEEVTIHTLNNVVCIIMNDDSLVLTMNDQVVSEDVGNVTVPVKLEQAAAAAFSVDYRFIDIEAVGGIDFDDTPGTLNFVGTSAGETQDIVIPITPDITDDDYETFKIEFLNCTDPAIDVTSVATITIVDGSATPIPINILVNDTINKPSYVPEETLVVKYYDNNDTDAEWFYWFYKFSDLTYPGLEPSTSTLENLEMLPVAVLRKDKVFCDVDKTAPLYLTTRLLMQRLGLPIDDFIENIGASPDIAFIDDVYVNFAMNPTTTHKLISKMLFFTYYELIVVNGLVSNSSNFSAIFTEGDINTAVAWSGHSYTADVVGVETAVGDYRHQIITTGVGKNLLIYYQKSATHHDFLNIHNLNGLSAIEYDGFHKMAVNTLGDASFAIPVSWFVFEQLSPTEHLIVYQHICRIDLYSIQVQELAWYQTSAFADLFEIVSWVFTIITLGTSSSFTELLKQLLLTYAIGELVVWIAEVTGNEALAALVGLVATIYVSDLEFSFEALTDPETLQNLATNFADNLLLAKGTTMQLDFEKEAEELAKDKEKEETVEESPVTIEFLMYLQSVDTTMFPAIQGQYEFNAMFNYDSLVGNYYSNNLKVGVV